MTASSLITDYIGVGTAAARPATPSLATGAFGLYYASDTGALSIWNGSSWSSLSGTGTVTSVGLSTPLGGGTVTSAGTLGTSSFTNHGVVLGQGSSALAVTSAGTAGQLLISGGASADPAFAGLSASSALCSADLSTTTTYQDVAGCTLTLGAGVWLLLATATVTSTSGINTVTVKLYNQSDTVDLVASGASLGGTSYWENIALSHIITLAASKTIRMAAVQNNSTGMAVKRYGDGSAPSPVSVPGTFLRAIQIG